MDQQATIRLLNSIMPEIAETRNPEAAMLKCAKAHNLTPAMLEKLGHVFNTSKTLIGLEKMANRGDSFTIVDVPSMVQSYTTYDPSAPLSKEDQKVHEKVDKITKYAAENDMWRALLNTNKGMQKAAGVNDWLFNNNATESDKLPDLGDILDECVNYYGGGMQYVNNDASPEWQPVKLSPTDPEIMHKAASAENPLTPLEILAPEVKDTRMALEDVISAAGADKFEKLAGVMEYISWDTSRWTEIVEDAATGMEKSALCNIVKEAEDYFQYKGLNVDPVNMEKLAVRALPRDRHNIAYKLIDADAANTVIKEARARLDNLEKCFEAHKEALKKTANSQTQETQEVNPLLAGMTAPASVKEAAVKALGNFKLADMVSGTMNTGKNTWDAVSTAATVLGGSGENKKQKAIDEAVAQAAKDATLQRLMLTDPIIQAADPYEVQDIYHAIADLSPNLAKSPMLMSALIKEQLQYGALPIQTTKDIANVEKTITDTEAAKQRINDNKYNG